MRKDQELAERRHEVRLAARAWHRGGILDGKTLDAILDLYPDDRARVSPAFRVLLFLFAGVAVVSAFTLFAVNDVPVGPLLLMTACVSAAATEIQMGRYRRAGTGSEEATALLAALFASAAYGWLAAEGGGSGMFWRSACFVTGVASTLAAWRWGVPALGTVAAASAFLMLAWWPGARIAWILLGAVLVLPLLRGSVSARLAPSHRQACDTALVTVLLALYVALHLGSFDSGLLEAELWAGFHGVDTVRSMRWFFVFATAAMPVSLLLSGLWSRRPLLLRSGIVFSVASLITLRLYVHVAPLWVVLAISGGIAVALAMLLYRYLRSGPGSERHGFTAEPVAERRSPAAVLEVGLAAGLAPASPEKGDEARFRGGGGEFGGGGASSTY